MTAAAAPGLSSGPAHYTPAAGARTAASLLLLRERGVGAGVEVLMLRRAEREGDVRSGAAVFPGGVLDARDREAHGLVQGADDRTISARMGLADGGLDYAVAAARESFEEVGVLLVDRPFDAAALHPWRARLNDGELGVAEFCRQHGFRLDLSGLVYWSHWLTPPGPGKRYDTRFFAARMPRGQEAVADFTEAAELMWLAPEQALDPARGLKLLPVTHVTLQELARHADVEAALVAGRARAEVPLMMPRRVASVVKASGFRVVLPGDAAYAEIGRIDPEGRADQHPAIEPGRPVRLSPHVWRVTAPNPGVMTGPGTNTYLVGAGTEWTCIDPGPNLPVHLDAIERTVAGIAAGARIARVLATHTHTDHSPGAAPLAARTGASVAGRRAPNAKQDTSFEPAETLLGGERLALAPGVTLRVIHTPGHASNHLCYLFEEEKTLFTGDHVMGGSTVVINPPDGDMLAYLASLEALRAEDVEWFAPGHGFLIDRPQAVLRNLIAHRLRREAKVVAAFDIAGTTRSLDELLPRVYDDVAASLYPVARRSLLAHLIKLEREQRVVRAGAAGAPDERYTLLRA